MRDIPSLPRRKRLPFIWTYYRFHICAILLLILALGAGFRYYHTRSEPDLQVLLSCTAWTTDEKTALEASLSSSLSDLNPDEKTAVSVIHIPFENPETADPVSIIQLVSLISAGECPLLLLNEAAAALLQEYGALAAEDGSPAATVSEAFHVPADALSDLEIPHRETLYLYRAVLPRDNSEYAEVQMRALDLLLH